MASWNLDQLKKTLSARKDVKAWIISQEHVHRRERYFLSDSGPGKTQGPLAVDQDREARSQNISARIFVSIPRPGRQGEITKKLFPALPLGPQLDAAVEAALQTDHQAWELPTSVPANLPRLATADPQMAEDLEGVVTRLTNEISSSVAKKRETLFNSSELFLSLHDREIHLSNGLIHRSSQSRIYVEAAYSMSEKDSVTGELKSDEYLNTAWSVSSQDLKIADLFDETADRAEHSLDVKKPETGKYPVIVDSEVLAMLFNGHIGQLSALNAYNHLPFVKPGDELIAGAREEADLLTITIDPSLDYGADTAAISDQGVAQTPLKLVEKNRVVATSTDKQYADYLASEVTTVRGNVVVDAGRSSYKKLTQAAPRVIEILQFSGLFADPNSGTFSSEIRLAKLYDNVKGTVSYIKGGSLSGSITENFKGAKLSSERVKRAHFESGHATGRGYYGPTHALLSDVSIVG